MPYTVLGIYHAGETKPQIMSANGKIVLFDNSEIAKNVLPLLGNGRSMFFDAESDTACFVPMEPNGVNRVVLLNDYDVYNLPPGLPVPSEARGLDWKHHVMWSVVFSDCGQMQQRRDGTWANTALGE